MKTFLALSALAATVYAKVGLLVPFYVSPLTGAAEWTSLIQTIDKHPTLDFYIIVNDQNGPPYASTVPSSTLPDNIKDWTQVLGAINARSNTKTLGYVFTGFGKRDYATVTRGISNYADWKTFQGWDGKTYDIHVDGIFFDEIDTNTVYLQRNLNLTAAAKSVFAATGAPTILNPGVAVAAGNDALFQAADSILDLETCYTTDYNQAKDGTFYRCPKGYTPFTPASLNSLPSDSRWVAKSSVVVHDFYEKWNPYTPASTATLDADIRAIINKKVHSFYIAQYGYTGNFTSLPASISEVARIAASAQGLA